MLSSLPINYCAWRLKERYDEFVLILYLIFIGLNSFSSDPNLDTVEPTG
jgi:hypothetical protein